MDFSFKISRWNDNFACMYARYKRSISAEKKSGDKDLQLTMGTLLPAFFWASMAGSFAFPGAKGLEAEFPDKVKKAGPIPLNEGFASAVMLALLATGFLLERKNS